MALSAPACPLILVVQELGSVDHNGMNFKKLNAMQPPWYACARRKNRRNPDEALLLGEPPPPHHHLRAP